MKITKTPFRTEVEFTPEELEQLHRINHPSNYVGLLFWLKDKFGLDMLPKQAPEEKI